MAFLIGGFGASDWFWSQLQSYFKSQGIELSRPSRVYVRVLPGYRKRVLLMRYSHKAVPDGALSFLVDHLVKSRVARATYGARYATVVDEDDPEHLSRREAWRKNAAGELVIPLAFEGILHKVGFGSFVQQIFDIDTQKHTCRVFKPMNKRNSVVHFAVLKRLSRSLVTSYCLSCAIEVLCRIHNGLMMTKACSSPSL